LNNKTSKQRAAQQI